MTPTARDTVFVSGGTRGRGVRVERGTSSGPCGCCATLAPSRGQEGLLSPCPPRCHLSGSRHAAAGAGFPSRLVTSSTVSGAWPFLGRLGAGFAFLRLYTVSVSFKNNSLPERLTAGFHESARREHLGGGGAWGPGRRGRGLQVLPAWHVPADRKGRAGGKRGGRRSPFRSVGLLVYQ